MFNTKLNELLMWEQGRRFIYLFINNNNNNKALFQAHVWPIKYIFSSTCTTSASGLCHR